MQAFSATWTPPTGTLGRIVAEAAPRVEALRGRRSELEREAAAAPRVPSMADALLRPTVAVIAEVKRRSPSKGDINPGLDPVAQATAYAIGGAAAISVLTEPLHFGGAAEDLPAIGRTVQLPLLKKDFHVDPIQLLEARALGASAALLIVRALGPEGLASMAREADALGLETLVEIRDERELEWALATGARMIGINNRDLETLIIDPSTSIRLLPLIPADRIAIAESGVSAREDVEAVAAAGARAVLVGSSISASPDPIEAVRDLADVEVVRA